MEGRRATGFCAQRKGTTTEWVAYTEESLPNCTSVLAAVIRSKGYFLLLQNSYTELEAQR